MFEGHVFCISDRGGLQVIQSEEVAASLASKYADEAIYFFAELTTESDEALKHTNFRDAGTGQFVTETYAQENPNTTVSES